MTVIDPVFQPVTTILPVGVTHVGCVIDEIVGVGGTGLMFIIADPVELPEVQLVLEFNTLNLYVMPPFSPLNVVVVPEPDKVCTVNPLLILTALIVHGTPDGKLVKLTLPVAFVHVGCVLRPTDGGFVVLIVTATGVRELSQLLLLVCDT